MRTTGALIVAGALAALGAVLFGAGWRQAGVATVSAANPLDENSFEAPSKIVPVETQVAGLGRTFTRTLPPYSLSIMRVGVR